MVASSSPAAVRTRALRSLRSLESHPDPSVQRTAKQAEAELAALPAGLDEYIARMAPPGIQVARFVAQIVGVPAPESPGMGYVFRRPVRLNVVHDGDYFVASSPSFLVHATGDTVEEAIVHYLEEWVTHYRSLVNRERCDELGLPLQQELARIRRLLRNQDPQPMPLAETT